MKEGYRRGVLFMNDTEQPRVYKKNLFSFSSLTNLPALR